MAKHTEYLYGDTMNSQDSEVGQKGIRKAVQCVEAAIKWRKDAKFDEQWAKMVKLYANRYDYAELGSYEDMVAPNMVFSTVNVIVPSVVVNYPKITVTATRQEFEEASATVEAVANYHWRHFDVHKEFRVAVKDFCVIGHGWCKTTWEYQERQDTWTLEEWQAEAQKALTQNEMAKANAEAQGADTNGFPTDEEVIAAIPKRKTTIIKDNPVVERVSPFDVYVDPNATRLKDAQWIAQRMYIPLEKAKKDKKWDKTARDRMRGVTMKEAKEDIDVNYDNEERLTTADFVVVWEYYDFANGTVGTFAEGADRWLAEPVAIPYAFDNPFVMLSNYDVPEKLYAIGDVEAIAPLQMELALTRTQMINDRKRYRRMYLLREDEIGPKGMEEIRSDTDNALIGVDSDRSFDELFKAVETSSLPPEFYNQTAMILDDINLVSGVSEYQRGSVAEIRRTATEAAMIQDASNARAADKLAIIERAIGDVAQRLVQLSQQFITQERVASITGEDGLMTWIPYTREAIQGEFDYSVEAGSTQPQNETSRRQSAMQMMDAMTGFVQLQVIDPYKLAEYVLRNGFGVKNTGEFMLQPQMPMMPGVQADQPLPPGVPA